MVGVSRIVFQDGSLCNREELIPVAISPGHLPSAQSSSLLILKMINPL